MKLKSENKIQLALISLVVFSLLVGISAISASVVDDSAANDTGVILNNGTFTMSVPLTAGTGYHWEVSPETHGADVSSEDFVADHPGTCGSSGTVYFNVHVNSDDYYVKLVLVSPTGDIVDEVDSDMLN